MRRLFPIPFLLVALVGCNDDVTTAVVENRFESELTVQKAWFLTTLFAEPVLPGESSAPERASIGDDYVYVLAAKGEGLAVEWRAMKSFERFESERAETLTIPVSNESFAGDCENGEPLSQEDADLVTQRIFPGEFAGFSYDAASCSLTPVAPADAGAD